MPPLAFNVRAADKALNSVMVLADCLNLPRVHRLNKEMKTLYRFIEAAKLHIKGDTK